LKERDTKGESKRDKASKCACREFKRDEVPLPQFFPLSLEGEGDTGGEGDK